MNEKVLTTLAKNFLYINSYKLRHFFFFRLFRTQFYSSCDKQPQTFQGMLNLTFTLHHA